jgi:thymidylate synthase (FAD)
MKIVPMKVELIDSMGSDLSVVNAARVSFHKFHDEFNVDKDGKLISYLAAHNHWSPFAHCFLSFRIKAPIFVARQLVKHQVGLAWNEVSRRYVDDEPEFFMPDKWRGKPVNAKQGSSDVVVDFSRDVVIDSARGRVLSIEDNLWETVDRCLRDYLFLIKSGVAPEQARMVLPQNMMTEWIWSGSLMAFARVCKLRLDPHAQAETGEIAKQIDALVPQGFEHSWRALLG